MRKDKKKNKHRTQQCYPGSCIVESKKRKEKKKEEANLQMSYFLFSFILPSLFITIEF